MLEIQNCNFVCFLFFFQTLGDIKYVYIGVFRFHKFHVYVTCCRGVSCTSAFKLKFGICGGSLELAHLQRLFVPKYKGNG